MKIFVFRLSKIYILLFVSVSPRAYASYCVPPEKQKLMNLVQEDRFTTGRRLKDYREVFGSDFDSVLNSMSPHDQWIDFGAGEGLALKEYSERFGKKNVPKLVGVSFKFEEDVNNIKIFSGRWAESIPEEELGPTKMITDLYGVFAYTSNPDLIVNKYFNVLKQDGVAFIYVGSFERHSQLLLPDGRSVSLFEWINAHFPHNSKILRKKPKSYGDDFFGGSSSEESLLVLFGKPPNRLPALELVDVKNNKPPKRVFRRVF